MVASPGGLPYFEEVFMFSHRVQQASTAFVHIKTASGHELQASQGHYIPSQTCKTCPDALARAADLAAGHLVWMSDRQSLRLSTIISVTTANGTGLYNPHTFSGRIVVNGILASTFTDTLPPSLWLHYLATSPAFMLYQLLQTRALRNAVNSFLLYFSSI